MKDLDFLTQLTFEPLSTGNWLKFVELFGERGACRNCWCMYYRLTKTEWTEGKLEDGNKEAMHALVRAQKPTGVLGMYEGQAIAWAAMRAENIFSRKLLTFTQPEIAVSSLAQSHPPSKKP